MIGKHQVWWLSLTLAAALATGPAFAKEMKAYSESEAREACARFIPRQMGETAFGLAEVHRDSMRSIGFACKIFLEGNAGATRVALSVDVMLSDSSDKAMDWLINETKNAKGPTKRIEGMGDAAFGFASYEDARLRGVGIMGVKGDTRFLLWTEPQNMSDAFFAQCVAFMSAFVQSLRIEP